MGRSHAEEGEGRGGGGRGRAAGARSVAAAAELAARLRGHRAHRQLHRRGAGARPDPGRGQLPGPLAGAAPGLSPVRAPAARREADRHGQGLPALGAEGLRRDRHLDHGSLRRRHRGLAGGARADLLRRALARAAPEGFLQRLSGHRDPALLGDLRQRRAGRARRRRDPRRRRPLAGLHRRAHRERSGHRGWRGGRPRPPLARRPCGRHADRDHGGRRCLGADVPQRRAAAAAPLADRARRQLADGAGAGELRASATR